MRSNVLHGFAVLLVALCIGALPQVARAQSIGMDAMLKQTGYAYNTHNPTTWSVDLTRKNFGKMRVILSTGSDILVTFVILAKKAKIQKTPQMMDALLTANHDYDYTKIGLDKDGDMFVRIDMPLRTIDATELKSIIDQVANASDEVYVKVAAWIKK
jgi:Putative bacterial sensory transduction regulator